MKRRYKTYIKINFVSLILVVLSFISITMAWFAYSGLSKVATEVNVKAWNIEMKKGEDKVSNTVAISFSDLYPGMETKSEIIKISNLGDSDAIINYDIVTARILGDNSDNYSPSKTITSEYIEDALSHSYPFKINISVNKKHIIAGSKEDALFEVSVSWPLDSDNDALDSLWGNKAYEFQNSEISKHNANSSYQIRPSIQIILNLNAMQYVDGDNEDDINFEPGSMVLFDIIMNKKCTTLSNTCLKTYVIDSNNKVSDTKVSLMLDTYNEYKLTTYSNYITDFNNLTKNWNVPVRTLKVEDLLPIISNDVTKSFLVRPNLSDMIIGNMSKDSRVTEMINTAKNYNGYFKFDSARFTYLSSSICYFVENEYDSNNAFAVKRIDENTSYIYNELKTNTCNIVPVIEVDKVLLTN